MDLYTHSFMFICIITITNSFYLLQDLISNFGFASNVNSDEPRHETTNILGSDTNQAVQLQKMARGLKFRI